MTAFSATLDVDNTKCKGYFQATDLSGNPIKYWYRFWGGDYHNQGVITVSKARDGDSALVVRFDETNTAAPDTTEPNTAARYLIDSVDSVYFYSDPKKPKQSKLPAGPGDQFDSAVAGNKRSVTIYDRIRTYDGEQMDYYYNIRVVDTAAKDPTLVIVCDPTIHNVGITSVGITNVP